jgi:hypothetical protein
MPSDADTNTKPPKPDAARASAIREPATHPVTINLGKSDVTLQLSDETEGEPLFCLGVRKSGSTMLHRMVKFLSRRNGINAVELPDLFFRAGYTVGEWSKYDLSSLVVPGNVYLGFRAYPAAFANYPHFRGAKKVFMFRDPRDALVSQYFSDAYSHSLPNRETEAGQKAAEAFESKRAKTLATDIDTYVMNNARGFENTLMDYAGLLTDPTCLTLRYEDFVFQKKRLIHKILQHYEWTCPPGHVDALLKLIDDVPEPEDQKRFVRRVIPGDHRNKLSPETIRKLNHAMRESLRLFDYY